MYIPGKFKCQLSFNLHLNLIEVCATQSWFLTLSNVFVSHGNIFVICFEHIIVQLHKLFCKINRVPTTKLSTRIKVITGKSIASIDRQTHNIIPLQFVCGHMKINKN